MRLHTYLLSALLLSGLAVSLPHIASADDLMSVYALALTSDPDYQAALAAHQAALEIKPQSRAALLPDVGISGIVSRDRYDPRDGGNRSYATNKTYSLGLRQAIYQRASMLQLDQADSSIAQANARLVAAQQDLVLRVATRYFLVLGAQDNLEFVQSDKTAIGRTLEQAQKRFEVGLAAITDTL
ncbi:MAG TPA: TolC family protein, partial [Gammaproteobacteria bacterium]|nr:TolC family protein [Gammaproteobacteria bacterium]